MNSLLAISHFAPEIGGDVSRKEGLVSYVVLHMSACHVQVEGNDNRAVITPTGADRGHQMRLRAPVHTLLAQPTSDYLTLENSLL